MLDAAVLLLAALLLAAAPEPPAAPSPMAYLFLTPNHAELTSGPVTVKLETAISGAPDGNAWARTFLVNDSPRPQVVSIAYFGEVDARRTVELAPGERRAVIVPIPGALENGRVEVSALGSESSGSHFFVSRGSEVFLVALTSESGYSSAVGRGPVSTESGAAESPNVRVATLSPDQLPLELAAYAGLDALYLADHPLESFDEARRRVIEAYLATGGRVALGRCTGATAAHLPLLARAQGPGPHPYGFGDLLWCGATSDQLAAFLGQHARPIARPRKNAGSNLRGETPALLPESETPVGRYFLIMLLFALAVGPGSYWVVRRRGAAVLLGTIPGTALATSMVIVGSAVIGDGLGMKASTRGFTLLDGHSGRAVSVGLGAFFAGVTPGDLRLPNTASWSMQQSSISLKDGFTLSRGFIPPRTYVEWNLSSVIPARARLQIRGAPGAFRLQNALGGPLRVVYAKKDGRLWVAKEVPDGGEATVHEATVSPAVIRSEFVRGWKPNGEMADRILSALKEGEFLAVVEGPGPLPLEGLVMQHRGSEQLFRGELSR